MPSTHSSLSWRRRKVALSATILMAIMNETYSFFVAHPTTTKLSSSFMTQGAHNHHKPHHHFDISENQDLDVQTTTSSSSSKRRQILQNIPLLLTSSSTTLLPHPSNAQQQQQSEQSEEGQFTPQQISQLLNPIPTYTLVEYPTGIPYAVVGEDAKLTSYFFTSYEEASRILSLATDSADTAIKDLKVELKKKKKSKEEVEEELGGGGNPWKNARISVVPLDFAVTLVYASKARKVGNMYFKVAPAEKDVEEALALSPSQKELAEGKVPLFYFEDFSLQDKEEKGSSGSGNKKSPLYFSKDELIAEWKKQNKGNNKVPDVKVTELFAVLSEMVNPQNTDPDLKSLYFVPPKDSLIKAKQTKAKNQKESLESPFVIGQRIIVL